MSALAEITFDLFERVLPNADWDRVPEVIIDIVDGYARRCWSEEIDIDTAVVEALADIRFACTINGIRRSHDALIEALA